MIKERVIQVIESKGIAKEKFYKKIGMTSASFRGNAKKTPLNSNAIENILSEINDLDPYWLITGKGEMFRSSKINDGQPNIRNENDTIALQKKIINLQENEIKRLEGEIKKLKKESENTYRVGYAAEP